MLEIASALLPGDLVFDVGANHGEKADSYLKAGARVILVEPQPDLAKNLRYRYENNSSVSVVEKAVGAAPSRLPMHTPSSNVLATLSDEWTQGRFKDQDWGKSIMVDVTTLDELISQFGTPRFIKIDVEGYELQAVTGLNRKVDCLSFEFTAEFCKNAKAVVDRLISLNFAHFCIMLGEEKGSREEFDWSGADMLSRRLDQLISADPMAWGDIYAA